MESFVLFHRENLTYHYAAMAPTIARHYNIIHVAYSQKEVNILKTIGITNIQYVFIDFVKEHWGKEKKDDKLLKEIDELFIEMTNGRFNLNGSLNSDRGFIYLSYEECLLLAQIYYKFWHTIFADKAIKYIIHESTSAFLLHLCYAIGKKLGIRYLYQISQKSDKYKYCFMPMEGDMLSSPLIEKIYQEYCSGTKKISIDRCQNFIDFSLKDLTIFNPFLHNKKKSLVGLWYKAFKEKIRLFLIRNKYDRITDNLDYYLTHQYEHRNRYLNIKQYRKHLVFHTPKKDEKYYFYPLHLEPESTLYYLSGGWFTNQIKLIENIARQLPVGTMLYVKDHPHEYGYRDVHDYIKLQNIPNVRLIERSIPAKRIIKDSLGVFTVIGTAGFEGLLLNKPVYTFSPSYYSICKNVTQIESIKDIQKTIYTNKQIDQKELYTFINAFLDCLYPGMANMFIPDISTYGLDLNANAKELAEGILDFIEKTKDYDL